MPDDPALTYAHSICPADLTPPPGSHFPNDDARRLFLHALRRDLTRDHPRFRQSALDRLAAFTAWEPADVDARDAG